MKVLSPDLGRIVDEYADLLVARDEAQRELRAARTRIGNKKRQMLKRAGEEMVAEAALNVAVVKAKTRDRTPPPEPPTVVLKCYSCGGTGTDWHKRVADGATQPPCERCAGSGVEAKPDVAVPDPVASDDGLCDACDGTGIMTDELGRGFCEACAGSGEAA